eukprot:scaffold190725_cov33-Tisochrysis_lutea.AAC.2
MLEDTCQRAHFDRVTEGRASSMGLQQGPIFIPACGLPNGSFDDRSLSLSVGCRQAGTLAILAYTYGDQRGSICWRA